MKAVAYFRYGGPDVMEYTELPMPVIRPGYALVKVRAASINPVDWKLRGGALRFMMGHKFPRIMGADVAGTIAEISGASDLKVADDVFGFASPADPPGSLAEFCLVPLERLAPLPPGLTFMEAAAMPCVGVTAHTALVTMAKITAGQRVLINGCTGGIGHLAVQIAKARGARVTGTCRTSAMEFAKGLGVDDVVDYTTTDIVASGRTFDVILETASTLAFRRARRIMAPQSVFLDPDLNFLNTLLGLTGRRYRAVMADVKRGALETLSALVADGVLKPTVGHQVPLENAVAAITEIERGRSVHGKTVFLVSG